MDKPVFYWQHKYGKSGFFKSEFKVLVIGIRGRIWCYKVSQNRNQGGYAYKDQRAQSEKIFFKFFPGNGAE